MQNIHKSMQYIYISIQNIYINMQTITYIWKSITQYWQKCKTSSQSEITDAPCFLIQFFVESLYIICNFCGK